MSKSPSRKVIIGEVVSSKMDKSVVVATVRKTPHPVFKKYVKKTKKYVAHDPDNRCNVGDKVEMVETRPLSRTKRWKIVTVLAKAEA